MSDTTARRQRDELAWLDDARLRCVIEGVDKRGAVTRVQVRISAGMQAIGPPRDNTEIELAPPPPDWRSLGREREKMSSRLATTTWTHARDAALPQDTAHDTARPADLLAAIEGIR